MKKFHLMIRGESFLVEIDGKTTKRGFFQNVFLEAESADQAESLGLKKVEDDEELSRMTQNPLDEPPRLICEEINELEDFPACGSMESGRAWFD